MARHPGSIRLFLFLTVIFIGACSQTPEPQDTLRMGLATAPLNLDPRFATDAASERINRLLYQRLVEFDAASMPVPGIADWQKIDDVHYRFRLHQPQARFASGEQVAARDVVASYEFVLDPAHASPQRATLEIIERIEEIDAATIDFFLRHPDPLFPAYLVLDILPANEIASAHPFAEQPVGSGPFLFLDRPEPGRIRLKRRRDGLLFELLEVKNPTVRVLKLLRGEIQLLQNDLSPELVDYLKSRPEVSVEKHPGSNFSYLGFNLKDPQINDRRIRQAISYAIDREAIIASVMRGGARPAEALFPPEHWAGGRGLQATEYSPDKSKALLAEAGYDEQKPLRLSYKTSSDPFRIRLATIIQAQLKEVGIEVDLRSYDWGTFFGDIKAGRFQLYSLTWVGLRTPDSFRYIFGSDSTPPKGANRGGYANPQVDGLLAEAEQMGDLEQQAQLYREVQSILHEELPYLPLWYEDHMMAARLEVKGYALQPNGNYDALNQVELIAAPKQPEVADAAH